MSDRPAVLDAGIDVVGEILDAAHLTTALYGRLELGAPWRIRIPARPYLSFYVVARGGGWIDVEGHGDHGASPSAEDQGNGRDAHSAGDEKAYPLSSGDAVLLPRGTPHTLRDADRSDATPIDLDYSACRRPWVGEAARFGGDGLTTTIVTGQFTFSGGTSRNPLLDTLPPLIHLPADAVGANPQLSGVMPLILNETARPGPGATIVLARLADLLLIHALRYWIATEGADRCGLAAVTDSSIGGALRLIHARSAEPWTVDSLASAVAMSRSAFAARFRTLVGEPPMQYLTRWRMTQAARLLAGGSLSIPSVAGQVGYSNPVAFAKAFTRFHGVGPGAWRRAGRG